MYADYGLGAGPPDPLAITIDHGDGRRAPVIRVAGAIDARNAAQLHKAVTGLLRGHRPSRIDINMRAVNFLDSAGIRALLLCHADAQLVECRLRLTEAQPMTYEVLQICGLAEYLGLTGSQGEEGADAHPPTV
jgi:anti-sigma B factor antagonist